MHPVAVVGRRRAVRGGANEWVCELHAPSDRQQSRVGRGLGRGHVDLEAVGGPAEQRRVADRLGRRGEDEKLRVGRQPVEAPPVALLRSAR